MTARDTLADADYFSAKIEEELKYLKLDYEELPELKAEKGEQGSGLASNIAHVQAICASMAYSRGDSIEDVRKWIVGALDDLRYLHEFYKEYPERIRSGRGSYIKALQRLTYALVYFPGPGPIARVIYDVEFFGKTDPILVAMLDWLKGKPVRRDRDDTELDFPDAFANLWHAMSYPESERVGALKRYLENWYADNLRIRGEGAPGIGAHEKMIRYQGYWCWEAAAVVVMMDIDDSSFRGHPHYPEDLVDWAKAQKRNS